MEIGKRYLGLVGVVFSPDAHQKFSEELEALKKRHLPYKAASPPILHRVDVMQARGSFSVLADPAKRRAFDDDLLDLIDVAQFMVIAIVLDKVEHAPKQYRVLKHPYHWSVLALLERYCGWLDYCGLRGDLVAESRGGDEDRAFKEAYAAFYDNGAQYLSKDIVQATLTTKEAKLEKKKLNTAGLQLADTLAHPLTRDVLRAYDLISDRGGVFADKISSIVESKYNRRFDTGRINGYGRKIIA